MNCVLETVAALWIHVVHTVNSKALQADLVPAAKEQLRDTIATMHSQIEKHERELVTVATTIRTNRAILSKERLNALLLKSRRTRSSIETIQNKLSLMEGQLDAMENNEVNKTILSTLQTSVKAMKKMGLSNDLRKTDDIISELEHNMECAHDINSTVSSSIIQLESGTDDESLEAELNMILGIEPQGTHTQSTLTSLSQETGQPRIAKTSLASTPAPATSGSITDTPPTENHIKDEDLQTVLAKAPPPPNSSSSNNNNNVNGPQPRTGGIRLDETGTQRRKGNMRNYVKHNTIPEEETESPENEAIPET